ncbi:MAG: hypothetical protein IKR81_06360 [Victivallales bacterium]|nr:hypothetical protein [Victivallales bacterium]
MKHILSLLFMLTAFATAAELKVLDKPMWVFPGQRFRICIGQEKGSGTLKATFPQDALKLFAQRDKDSDQRFYFTAEKTGVQRITFDGKGGHLEMDVEVIAWADVYAPRKYGSVVLPRIWPMNAPYQEAVKTRRTLLNDDEYAEQLGKYKKKPIFHFKGLSDEQVFNLIPGPAVARTCLIVIGNEPDAKTKGCPVCGTDIYKGRNGFYPWILDSNNPWKVTCPNCKTSFPSNDWANGDMSSGDFPDDGFGCEPAKPHIMPNGQPSRWPFIAYYHQTNAYMRQFIPGLEEAAFSGLANNDKKALHLAAIALFRYAESMLDMSLNMNHRKIPNRDGILRGPVGSPLALTSTKNPETFLYIQPNWDTPIMEKMALIWDCMFDKLDDDQELIAFCQSHYHPEITDITAFKRFIDAGVLRVPIQAAIDNKIARNYPQQESTALTLALAYGTEQTLNVADWLLNEKGIRFALTNQYYKDGHAHESPSYNSIQINDMTRIFDTLDKVATLFPDKFVPPKFVSPRNDPKYRLQFDAPLDFGIIGRHYPMVGDTGAAKRPAILSQYQGYPLSTQNYIAAYKHTGDERFLQALYGPSGNGLVNIKDKELASKVEEVGKRLGWQVQTPSNFQDGYGMVFLRSGKGNNQRAAWLRYQRMVQHAHVDMLTWGYAANMRDLTPELGYPIGWSYAGVWEHNWGTHYGTHITGLNSVIFNKGALTAFVPAAPIQVAVAESAYKDAKNNNYYRERTLILVDISPEESYVLTLERVQGGSAHTVSFHTQEGNLKTNVPFTPYEGTALGAGLKYGDFSSEKDKDQACLSYIKDPASAIIDGPLQIDLEFFKQPHTGYRVFSLMPPGATTIKAHATPPGGGNNAYDLPWFITKYKGENGLKGQYLHIMNPYTQAPYVERIEQLDVKTDAVTEWQPFALRIYGKGFTDTFILQKNGGVQATAGGVTSDGLVGFTRHVEGKCVASTLVRGTTLTTGEVAFSLPAPAFNAKIAACDWKHNTITLDTLPPQDAILLGRHIRIYNEYGSSASYIIQKVETDGGKCVLTLNLDPRIGEGYVRNCTESAVHTKTELRMCPCQYYNGKCIVNEKGDRIFTVKNAWLYDINVIGNISKPDMIKAFPDADGDGNIQFTIYDYGPGDAIQIDFSVEMR